MKTMWISCGQEVAVIMGCGWDFHLQPGFAHAAAGLEQGHFRETPSSSSRPASKHSGLLPGDLITVTYPKENLERTPFRITKITPGNSFRTATITAQFHDDDWYSDTATGITGGFGRQSGQGSGLPAPVIGTVFDANGNLQLGITESRDHWQRRLGGC